MTRIVITAPADRLGSIPALLQQIGRKIDNDERFDPAVDGFGYRRDEGDVSTILPARVKLDGNTVAAFADTLAAALYVKGIDHNAADTDATRYSITFEMDAV